MARAALVLIGLVILAACGSTGFAVTGATVDGTYMCSVGSASTRYDLHSKISADNSTSKSVDVRSIDAVLVVSAVHGQWEQAGGGRYGARAGPFSPRSGCG